MVLCLDTAEEIPFESCQQVDFPPCPSYHRSLFSALPPPKASLERPAIVDLQSELSLSGTTKPPSSLPPKKGVVQFRPPIDTSYLTKADDRDEDSWQPPKKKVRQRID